MKHVEEVDFGVMSRDEIVALRNNLLFLLKSLPNTARLKDGRVSKEVICQQLERISNFLYRTGDEQ